MQLMVAGCWQLVELCASWMTVDWWIAGLQWIAGSWYLTVDCRQLVFELCVGLQAAGI